MAGIGVIGVFTATIATLFFEQEKESELAAMAARLNAIDQKLDELLSRDRPVSSPHDVITAAIFRVRFCSQATTITGVDSFDGRLARLRTLDIRRSVGRGRRLAEGVSAPARPLHSSETDTES
jgi:hypothetical protein